MSSLTNTRLFIRFQILVSQFLMRFEGRVGVFPKMETESAHAAHDGHNDAHQHPDGSGHVLCAFGPGSSKTLRTRQSLTDRRAEKQTDRDDDSRFHVMMRSRFIFR